MTHVFAVHVRGFVILLGGAGHIPTLANMAHGLDGFGQCVADLLGSSFVQFFSGREVVNLGHIVAWALGSAHLSGQLSLGSG